MRKLLVLLALMLAACGSQSRDDYVDDVWDTYDPSLDRPTYDERYVPPSRMNADQLVERAMGAERDQRDDQARVDYHAAFRRDRWHTQANRRYQDLMLRNGLFDTVWQEYLDLWQTEPARGDAFWFHLRPMLLKRAEQPMPLERASKLDDDQLARINELTAESAEKAQAGDRAGALAAIDSALEIADLPELHRVRIELRRADDYEALLAEYAERAEENPASGDNLYLHARVLAYRDVPAALEMLRGGWILDVPGWWLRFGIGEFTRELGDGQLDAALEGDQGAQRSAQGWYATAEAFLTACKEVRPKAPETLEQLGWITTQRNRLE